MRHNVKQLASTGEAPRNETAMVVPGPWGKGEVTLRPRAAGLSGRWPACLLLAPNGCPSDDIEKQVAHSLIVHGQAVFPWNRFAIYNADIWFHRDNKADEFGSDLSDDTSPDLPGIGKHVGAPEVIQKLRGTGWPLIEVDRSTLRPDHLTGELRAYALRGREEGQLFPEIRLWMARNGAAKANRLLWPTCPDLPH